MTDDCQQHAIASLDVELLQEMLQILRNRAAVWDKGSEAHTDLVNEAHEIRQTIDFARTFNETKDENTLATIAIWWSAYSGQHRARELWRADAKHPLDESLRERYESSYDLTLATFEGFIRAQLTSRAKKRSSVSNS